MAPLPPLTPLIFAARARLGLARPIEASAVSRELSPAEETPAPRATILEGRLERLRNFETEEEKARVLRSIAGGRMRHRPTLAHTIRNAKLLAGSAYANGGRIYVRPLISNYPGPAPDRIKRAALCTSATGDRYFGHFMTEDAPQTMIAPDFGEAIRWPDRDWPHLPVYRRALGLQWREVAAASVDELTFFSDYAQNALRRSRYLELRRRIRKNVAPLSPGARIYMTRAQKRDAGVLRSPTNDEAICAALAARGFDILDVDKTPPEIFVRRLLEAKLLVSPEGSQMCHGVYTLAENAGVGILLPPMRPVIQIKDRFDALGIASAIVVGDDHGTSYAINIDDLHRTLDRLEARLRQSESAAMSSPKSLAMNDAPASSRRSR
jgi:capsular polysaccharide biosynthesis protein